MNARRKKAMAKAAKAIKGLKLKVKPAPCYKFNPHLPTNLPT